MSSENKTPRVPVAWVPKSPDGGWGWVVVFGSFLIHVFTDGIVYSFGIMIVEFLRTFQEGRGLTSWIISILIGLTLGAGHFWMVVHAFVFGPVFLLFSVCLLVAAWIDEAFCSCLLLLICWTRRFCLGPVASAVTNRFGCRAATMAGSVIASLGCALCFFANSILYLMISVGVIVGVGFGLTYCPAIIIVTMYFEERRSLATGIAVCGAGFGTFIFAPLSTFLIKSYGWRGTFLIYSGLVLNCAVCGALFRPLEFVPVYDKEETALETCNFDASNNQASGSKFDISRSSKSPETKPSPEQEKLITDKICHENSPNEFRQEKPRADTISHLEEGLELEGLKERFDVRKRTRGISESTGYLGISDVFYFGSVSTIAGSPRRPIHRSLMSLPHVAAVGAVMERTDSEGHVRIIISRPPSEPSIQESHVPDVYANFLGFLNDVKKVLKRMINFSLLKDPLFIIFVISNFLTSIALNAPLIFLPDKATDRLGIDKNRASWLLSVYGLCNTAGRILIGYLSDNVFPCKFGKNIQANRLWIYNISLTLSGIFTLANFLCNDYTTLMIYAGLFGLSMSTYICLTSVILVDLLGIDKLTNAFGLLLLFEGIASVLGPPIAGWIVDYSGNFDNAFYFAGICLASSGIVLYVVPCLQSKFSNSK